MTTLSKKKIAGLKNFLNNQDMTLCHIINPQLARRKGDFMYLIRTATAKGLVWSISNNKSEAFETTICEAKDFITLLQENHSENRIFANLEIKVK